MRPGQPCGEIAFGLRARRKYLRAVKPPVEPAFALDLAFARLARIAGFVEGFEPPTHERAVADRRRRTSHARKDTQAVFERERYTGRTVGGTRRFQDRSAISSRASFGDERRCALVQLGVSPARREHDSGQPQKLQRPAAPSRRNAKRGEAGGGAETNIGPYRRYGERSEYCRHRAEKQG